VSSVIPQEVPEDSQYVHGLVQNCLFPLGIFQYKAVQMLTR
jgi:hypothetical protein